MQVDCIYNPQFVLFRTRYGDMALQLLILIYVPSLSLQHCGQCHAILTLKQLGYFFSKYILIFCCFFHYKCNILVKLVQYNEYLINTVDTNGLVLYSTRASVATEQNTHPCISSCLWVNTRRYNPYGWHFTEWMSEWLSLTAFLEQRTARSICILQRTFPFLEIKSVYWFKFHWHLFQGSTSQSVIIGLGNGFVLNKQQSFTSWTFDDLVFPCIHTWW